MPRKPKPIPTEQLTPAHLPPGKTYAENASHLKTRAKLGHLRRAEFPREYEHFKLWHEYLRHTPEGRQVCASWESQIAEVKNTETMAKLKGKPMPTELFLPYLQTHLLKAENARLTAELHPPRSPKWELAGNERNPVLEAKLYNEAQQEDAQAKAERERARLAEQEKFFEALCLWSRGRSSQDYTPPTPKVRLWFDPMTVADYKMATAVSRTTIKKFLGIRKDRRAKKDCARAKPLNPDKGAFEAFRYGTDINFKVLGKWLVDWLKDVEKRQLYFAWTAAHCEVHAPGRLAEFVDRLGPDWKRILKRICPTQELRRELLKLENDLVQHLAPTPPPPDPLSALLSGPTTSFP